MQFAFIVHGDPVAKGRPKFRSITTKAGHTFGSAYTPAKTRKYEAIIRETAIQRWNGQPVLKDIALFVLARFYRAVPSSWSKRKQADALAGVIRPITKPDSDNLFKSVTDALNGVIYHDDAQIVDQQCSKFYAVEPRVEIVINWTRPSDARDLAEALRREASLLEAIT